jgi:hypothetical protein
LVFAARGQRRLPDGMYLSEQPGNVNPAADGVVVPEADPMIYRPLFWAGTRGGGTYPSYGGWGGARADSTPYGEQLTIAGRRFDTGIGILADSRMEVRNRGFRRFSAMVGVDDSSRARRGSVTFALYGDGKLLVSSKAMRFGESPVLLSATIRGYKLLELVARTRPRNDVPPVVTWGDAALTD